MPIIEAILQFLSLSRYGINMLDVIIILTVVFYAYEGYIVGFAAALLDLSSFLLSFILALKTYNVLGGVLVSIGGLAPGFGNALGFFIIALVSEVVLNLLFRRVAKRYHLFTPESFANMRTVNHLLGLIPGTLSAFVILAFLLSVVISLPSSVLMKTIVMDSKLGRVLVSNTAYVEKGLKDVFGGALNETLTFLTVNPKSDEVVMLKFTVTDPTPDEQSEIEMLRLVNLARKEQGLPPVNMDSSLRDLARDYATDMFKRSYFAHYDPDGKSPFDRMDNAGITYLAAGENLALAPTVDLAMQGLMNSPGHRANILSDNFGKVGIGVMDGGIYGKMFVQEFTD